LASPSRRSALRPAGSVAPVAHANRVTYDYAGVTEWFANGPLGLEQGFSVGRAAAPPHGGTLTLLMGISGGLRASLLHGRRSVSFEGAGGASLRYDGLTASDASGRPLRAWLELRHGHLALRVATRNARYPIRIDPFVQQGASLTGGGEWAGGGFGASVALSADGNTALIGGPSDNFRVGAAWVFTRSGSTWTQQGSKLLASGERGEGQFGTSVALSADGNTALIGGIGDDKSTGAVWVFTRSGTTWTQDGEKLVGSAPEQEGRFGQAVALSGDGATALIGCGPFYGHGGGVWFFKRTGSTWSQQGPRIEPTGEIGEGEFGSALALSSDGSTALVGARRDNQTEGAAWVFTRNGEEWLQQGEKLTGTEESGGNGFGESGFGGSVALSGEGNTALIGGPWDTNESGAAWVFTRTGSSWAQQGPKWTAGEGVNGYYGYFGGSVALSSSGNLALIGGRGWIFARSGSTWTEQQPQLFNGDNPEDEYGGTVALSGDGTTALFGDAGATVGNTFAAGRVFVYTSLPQAPRIVAAPASAVTPAAATLNAKVDPNGYKVKKCEFEYGTSLAYEHSIACATLPGAGESLVAVSAAISGLSEETTYHFRVVATSAEGTSDSTDETFTTLPLFPSFTWSGRTRVAGESSFDWSLATNWLGESPPGAGEQVRNLTFPELGAECEAESPAEACYETYDDASGIRAEGLRMDDAEDYLIAGEPIDLGAGGLAASPAGAAGPAGDVLADPLELSAPQTWKLDGSGSLGEEAGVLLAEGVTGPGKALEVHLSEEPVLYLAENDVEVGPLSIDGADAGRAGVLNGVVALLGGRLNSGDGQSVALRHMFLTGGGTTGPLTTEDAELDIGDPDAGIEAASLTLDAGSRLEFNITGAGSAAKAEYSQLVSHGTIALAGASLGVVVRPPKAGQPCPALSRGRTYTLVSTTGALSGTFANAPAGTELPLRYAAACAPRSQTLRIEYHESGALHTVTGTLEEAALLAEEQAAARRLAEQEAARIRAAEEAFGVAVLADAAVRAHAETGAPLLAHANPAQVRLADRSLLADRAGAVGVRLSCPPGASRCAGTLILRASAGGAQSRASGASSAPIKLAVARFSIRAGQTRTVVLELNTRARLLLQRRRTIGALVTLASRDSAAGWHSRVSRVTIRAERRS
jgi:hypothetical protein